VLKKVLIVDDDMRNIYSLTNVLEEEGKPMTCKEMIDTMHELPVKRQAELLDLSRSNVYYLPRPVSDAIGTVRLRPPRAAADPPVNELAPGAVPQHSGYGQSSFD
jgi:putative transposase